MAASDVSAAVVAQELKAEVVAVYHRYIEAFNAGDLDGCVTAFALPYFDLRTADGAAVQKIYATEADCRQYFIDVTAQMRAAGWKGSSRTVQTEVWSLGADLVMLLVDFERLTAEGELMSAHRVFYTLVRQVAGWKIAGYAMADPGYSGPGDVPLPA